MSAALRSRRIGPGHYEVSVGSQVLGWLFDDVRSGGRPATDPEPWRFSPVDATGDAFSARTKADAINSLRAAFA